MFDVAIFTALGWERRAVTASLPGALGGPPRWEGWLPDGSSCVVVQTGMGPERAQAAAREIGSARVFLACGCAGALVPWLRPGDLVVANRVVALDGAGRSRDLPATADPIVAWAAARGRRLHVGPILSSPTIFTGGERGDALVVEMENAGIAAEALARGIPFVALRVVLDMEDQAIPFVDSIGPASGELRTAQTMTSVALRPWLWPAVARLAWQSRVADRELRKVMHELLGTGTSALLGATTRVAVAN